MSAFTPGPTPVRTTRRDIKRMILVALVTATLAWGLWTGTSRAVHGATAKGLRPNVYGPTTSRAARQSALRGIPLNELDAQARAKVDSVLSKVSIFRRMPTRAIDCDPSLYLFLIRHPDVVVNIWEVLKVSSLKLRQVGPMQYRVNELDGTLANVEYLYQSHDTHVIYAEGSYDGPLLARPVTGRCLLVLKSGYVRETNGRHYVTTRLDTFLSVDHAGVELLTKAIHPLIGKTADSNFVQSLAFLGSLSRTAEVNLRGVQRLAARLAHVKPEYRRRLTALAAGVAKKSTAQSRHARSGQPQIASRTVSKPQ